MSKYLILLCCFNVVMLQETARLEAELQLDNLELIDRCELLAEAQKEAFLKQKYQKKINQEQLYGSELKVHYDVLRQFTEVPTEFERNWNYQVKPGDSLLSEAKWNKIVLYQNHIEELLENDTNNSKSNYYEILNHERQMDVLQNAWTSWHNSIYNESDVAGFKGQMELIKEAANLNEFETIQQYWGTLVDFEGAYEQADTLWEEIAPFYKKLQEFVRQRLHKYYDIEDGGEEIDAYLLGGELGTDWSNIADIILPHPQLHYDAESYLKYKDVKQIYILAENVSKQLNLGSLGSNFWTHSSFNATTCGPQLYEFCLSEYTEIIECNKPSWPLYLYSHETAMKIGLNNLDYTSLPRQRLRYCAIDDAVETLGSLLAIESLNYHGIAEINTTAREDTVNMTKLLLVALRVMPKLAYSIMADKWRLELLENKNSAINITETWWNYRREFMGIRGLYNNESDYLEDTRITSNKPYINSFFGVLIAFQMMAFYTDRSDNIEHIVKEFGQDDTFITLIKARHTLDWPYLLSIHYGFDLGTAEILKYFEPLEQYFESAPLEQVPLVTTTTTTTTTTRRPTTTTEPIIVNVVVNDQPNLRNISLSESVLKPDTKVVDNKDSHTAMYIGVGIAVLIGCALIIVMVRKQIRRRRRTNNRRFDT